MLRSKCVALVIVNWKYPTLGDLGKPQEDGKLLKKLMNDNKYEEVIVHENIDDIKKSVEEFREYFKNKYNDNDVMHFHFSGHGVDNNSVRFDPNKTTSDGTHESEDPYGQCLVGCHEKLYSVRELKFDLVQIESQRYTITLDMCRSQIKTRAAPNLKKLYLKEETKLDNKYLERVFIFWATYELHDAADDPSFSKELHDLLDKQTWKALPIKELTKRINKSWEQRGISQRCIPDMVECGDNWENFWWPSNNNEQEETATTEVDGVGSIDKKVPTKTEDKKAPKEEIGTKASNEKVVEREEKVKRTLEDREKKQTKHNYAVLKLVGCLVVAVAIAVALRGKFNNGERETQKMKKGLDVIRAAHPLMDRFASGRIGMAKMKLLSEKFGNRDMYENLLVSPDKPTGQAKVEALLEDWIEKGKRNDIGALIKILREIGLVSVAEDIQERIDNIDSN